jgi:hypothetical protein
MFKRQGWYGIDELCVESWNDSGDVCLG